MKGAKSEKRTLKLTKQNKNIFFEIDWRTPQYKSHFRSKKSENRLL
jgi:hypothetical protein